MRARNHALDGLRGLAALGVLTLHVWMFTVQDGHDRRELVSLLDRRAAPRRGAVLRALGLSARRAVGGERPGRAPGAAPGALRGQARGAHRPRLLGRDARLLLAAERDRARLRGERRPAAAVRRLRAELRRRGRRQARPADVVAGGRGELLRGAPARRVAAGAGGAARAHGGGLLGLAAIGVAWSAAGALLAWPETAMSTLPTFLPVFACGMAAAALAHRATRRARRGGRCCSSVPPSWPATRGGITRAPA